MMFFGILLPMLLLTSLVLIVVFTKNMKRTRLRKTFHRNIVVGYLALLLIGLVVAEVMERTVEQHALPKVLPNNSEFDLYTAITEGKPIPERLVLAERSHEVQDTLLVSAFTSATIFIERTPGNGNTIAETVYSPELMVSIGDETDEYYDFTEQLEVALPIWENGSMSVPKQPANRIQYTFYHDSNIVNQFTGEKTHGYTSGSMSGAMMIHLAVPESITLNLPETENEYGAYIEVIE
ncbi:hypothetical protein [Sporosarcina sp. P33]|uniref:hypothetical protein n=1 Tax=Sporosarcina sp. P33 TaxID=1930764 RepID=UPI0009C04588|nr:hypothetical protein [Sporosarcina sp. P33]ARD48297.1 hypothetical protein SporoP33_08680 [Sporosarcina sp. P33]